MFLSQFSRYLTLASEVVFLKMPSRNQRRDLSNERNTSKNEKIFYHNRPRLKPERATRPTLKRRRPLYATPTTQMLYLSVLLKGSDIRGASRRTVLLKGSDIKRASRRTVLLKGSDIKRASRRTVLLKGSDIKRASRRTVLLKGSDIKRASRRTVLLIGGYTGAIQLPLRQLEGVGIGRVVELPLPPKGML